MLSFEAQMLPSPCSQISSSFMDDDSNRVKQVDALNYLDKANAEIDMDEINGTFSQQPIMFRPGGKCPVVSKQQIPVSFMLKYLHVSIRC